MSKILIALVTLFLSSCGIVQKVAVGTTADMFFDASKEIETEGNWEIFKDGVPGNLKMTEGMVYVQPKNEKLLVGLAKGYAGYAFAVSETQYLPDMLRDKESPYRFQMMSSYSKSVDFGLKFLEANDVGFDDLKKSMNEDNGIVKILDKNLNDSILDLEGVLYTAQSLGSLIFLQKESMSMIALLPIVKGMFDWVCMKKPDINYGTCDIFYGAYEAGRPKMLGGNPAKGKEIFKKLMTKYPNNWLIHISYLRFYVIPMSEEDEFKKEMEFMKQAREKFLANIAWKPKGVEPAPEFKEKGLLLFQTIAVKQYEMIKSVEKDLL